MPDVDLPQQFVDLGRQLEAAAHQPGFSAIRSARWRRTRRLATAGAATTVLLAVTAAVALGAMRQPHPGVVAPSPSPVPTGSTPTPTEPAPTPSVSPTRPGPALVAIAAAPAGQLFGVAQACAEPCQTTPVLEHTLIRSTDVAAHWSVVAPLPEVLDASIKLFTVNGTRLWLVQEGDVRGSADGGRTWQRWHLGTSLDGTGSWDAALAGGALWVVSNGALWVATGSGGPQATAVRPGSGALVHVFPVTADRAYVIDSDGSWFVTPDRGSRWTPIADPCAGTVGERSTFDTLVVAPGGAQWLVCAGEPGLGMQLKRLKVSTNGGGSWSDRGELERRGYGTAVYPLSATVAWRSGGRSAVFRTTDGRTWTAVADPPDGPWGVVAIDASTALYTEGGDTVFVTHDGGISWTALPVSF